MLRIRFVSGGITGSSGPGAFNGRHLAPVRFCQDEICQFYGLMIKFPAQKEIFFLPGVFSSNFPVTAILLFFICQVLDVQYLMSCSILMLRL